MKSRKSQKIREIGLKRITPALQLRMLQILGIGTAIYGLGYLIWRPIFSMYFGISVNAIIGTFVYLLEILAYVSILIAIWQKVVSLRASPVESPLESTVESTAINTHTAPNNNHPKIIDILICTYKETEEIVAATLAAAMAIRVPAGYGVKVFLCDDSKRQSLAQLATEFGATYLSRYAVGDEALAHSDGKRGNLNFSLQHCHGEFLVSFDADAVAEPDFLEVLIPYMDDPLVGFVQSPQWSRNRTLFEKRKVLNFDDQYLQYQITQPIYDKVSKCAILCGTNFIMRRKALDDVGGFSFDCITEDFPTGVLIKMAGYKCLAVKQKLATVLSPQTLQSLITQRKRWNLGSLHTGRDFKIVTNKDLDWRSKIALWNKTLQLIFVPVSIFFMPLLLVMYFSFDIHPFSIPAYIWGVAFVPMFLLTYIANRLINETKTFINLFIFQTVLNFYLLIPSVLIALHLYTPKVFHTTTISKDLVSKYYDLGYYLVTSLVMLILVIQAINATIILCTNFNLSDLVICLFLIFFLYVFGKCWIFGFRGLTPQKIMLY